MNDMRLLLEEQTSRNTLLEKKQKKFDSELAMVSIWTTFYHQRINARFFRYSGYIKTLHFALFFLTFTCELNFSSFLDDFQPLLMWRSFATDFLF
jgi:hypothetical protein